MACCLGDLRVLFGVLILLASQGTVKCGRTLLSLDCDNDDLNGKALDELHNRLDDDQDGSVETLETSQFLVDEFHHADKRRRDRFHARDDHVSLDEFRKKWRGSAVYNWTEGDMVNWLTDIVQLPQYVKAFEEHDINGHCLPRLAINYKKILVELGVSAKSHRKKIKVRALDVVLFGVPPAPSSFWMTFSLVVVTTIAIVVGYYGIRSAQQRREMQALLSESRKQLEEARIMQERLYSADSIDDASSTVGSVVDGKSDGNNDQVALEQARRDLRAMREQLIAQQRLAEQSRSYQMPYELARLLHSTYQRENAYYEKNLLAAKKRLQESEEAYLKIDRKIKRSTLIPSSIRLSGGRSLAELDRSIVESKTSFHEVLNECKERNHRWKRIEALSAVAVTSAAVISAMAKRPSKDVSPHHKSGAPNQPSYGSLKSTDLMERQSVRSQLSDQSSSTISLSSGKSRYSPTAQRRAKADSPQLGNSRSARTSPGPSLKESRSAVSLPLSASPSHNPPSTRSSSLNKESHNHSEDFDLNKIGRSGSLPIGVDLAGYRKEMLESDQQPTFSVGSIEEDTAASPNVLTAIQMSSVKARHRAAARQGNGDGKLKHQEPVEEDTPPESEV